MTTVADVWLVVGLVGLLLGVVFTVALIRHMVLIGRAVARFAREASEVVSTAPGRGGERASR